MNDLSKNLILLAKFTDDEILKIFDYFRAWTQNETVDSQANRIYEEKVKPIMDILENYKKSGINHEPNK